jgi:hypothetical protein
MTDNKEIELDNIDINIDKIENIKNANPEIDIDDFIQYKTCCSNSSKAFINYLARLFISCVIISFCVYMIINSDEGEDNSIHYSLISSIMAVYIQPNHDDKK